MTTTSGRIPSTLLLLIFISFASAETINLSGMVRNKATKPVMSALVQLAGDTAISVTTDSTGKFTLTGQITSIEKPFITGQKPSVAVRGRFLRITLTKASPVTIAYHTMAGRKLFNVTTKTLDPGTTVLALPKTNSAAGFSLLSVECERKRHLFRYATSGRGELSSPDGSIFHETPVVVRKAGLLSAGPIDTLLVSATGYLITKFPITSYSQSDIEILLERVSRLINITRSCDGITIAAGGGQNGWGSRYWDCCKPHCSSPFNTNRLCANCATDGIDETPCFKVVGNEYSTWNEATKSGCESDGVAYACYRHVPYAVCENLAYGYAAVPGAGSADACGKCFQLTFDGGSHNNDVKAAHKAMKGKTMIVMASNIGHDVSGGQFDLMIPGGGVGAFSEGCRRQWNVNVTDENVVGKNLGGFISKCQDKLGWDASLDSLKLCVRSMCDNLFGNDPSRHDLWEGCVWYVEWMNAVDNPTFTYKEVECPKELVDLYYSSMHPKP